MMPILRADMFSMCVCVCVCVCVALCVYEVCVCVCVCVSHRLLLTSQYQQDANPSLLLATLKASNTICAVLQHCLLFKQCKCSPRKMGRVGRAPKVTYAYVKMSHLLLSCICKQDLR